MSPFGTDIILVTLALKGSLLLLLGFVIAAFLRRTSASTRHLLWTATLAALLLLPATASFLPPLQVSLPTMGQLRAAQESLSIPMDSPLPSSASAQLRQDPSKPSSEAPKTFAPLQMLAPIYSAGALLVLLWLGAGVLRAWQLTRRARPLEDDPRWLPLLSELPRGLGKVRLLASPDLQVPMTWGFFRPVVLLPSEAISWPREDRQRALIHELAHVQRHDWLTQMIARGACALYWFQPLVWLAARRQGLEAERAADDRVLLAGSEATVYAEQLVSLVHRLRRPALSLTLSTTPMARRSQLPVRIQAILDPNHRRYPMSVTFRILLASLLLIPALVLSATERSFEDPEAGSSVAESLLFQAVEAGDLELVQALIDAGADVNAALPGDGSPLIQAAVDGALALTQLLIERGADVNLGVPGDGSPLIAAARNGHVEVLGLLLQTGATIDLVIEGDENPLIQASGNGHLEAVKLLVVAGADVNARVIANGSELRTPLNQARKEGYTAVVDFLLTSGARE